MRRLALAVAALLALAGSSGAPGTPTAGVTPVPVPNDAPPTPERAAVRDAEATSR